MFQSYKKQLQSLKSLGENVIKNALILVSLRNLLDQIDLHFLKV